MHILPSTYQNPIYPYKRSSDQDAIHPKHHPVVIVGAGPVGLTAALDLANRGIPCVVLGKGKTVSIGSRAICFAKKTLEIVHRLDRPTAERMLRKGVTWHKGKVFYQQDPVYEFDLLPESGHKAPAFINLQQYYFEEYLVDAVTAHPLIDLRWQNELVDSRQVGEEVELTVKTPEGDYELKVDYLLACDGVKSPTRERMGIPFEGETFEENFLIADITMQSDFPTERWFWFDPPFNKGYSALLHKQPDGVWRIDLQLGWDIDKEKELDPKRIKDRLRQMLGDAVQFELEWTSIYQFRCMRIHEFIHGRVIFLGDSAHLVSPFGARGANGGVQDADNLSWKLAYVIKGLAPISLLTTYQTERSPATDENIYHSTNATDFITPKSDISTLFRNATLALAKHHPPAQKWVNSGRLSDAYRYIHSPLTTPDQDAETWKTELQPGDSIKDVPLTLHATPIQLLEALGNDFSLVIYHHRADSLSAFMADYSPPKEDLVEVIAICGEEEGMLMDAEGLFAHRYGAEDGTWYLVRPDHYIAARGRDFASNDIETALLRAFGQVDAPGSNPPTTAPFTRYPQDQRYKMLLEAHQGLSKEESEMLNAKLILLMMEEVDLAGVLGKVEK